MKPITRSASKLTKCLLMGAAISEILLVAPLIAQELQTDKPNNINFGPPRITKLSIKSNNVYLSIYSDRPWKLFSTTDFKHYTFLYSSEPMPGFNFQFFEGIDWGGGYGKCNFYVLYYIEGESGLHEVPPIEYY